MRVSDPGGKAMNLTYSILLATPAVGIPPEGNSLTSSSPYSKTLDGYTLQGFWRYNGRRDLTTPTSKRHHRDKGEHHEPNFCEATMAAKPSTGYARNESSPVTLRVRNCDLAEIEKIQRANPKLSRSQILRMGLVQFFCSEDFLRLKDGASKRA